MTYIEIQTLAARLHQDYLADLVARDHSSPLSDPNCLNGMQLYLEKSPADRSNTFWDLMHEGGDGSLFNELSWHLNHLEANRHFDETLALYAALVGFVAMAAVKEDLTFLNNVVDTAASLDDRGLDVFMSSPLIKEPLTGLAERTARGEGSEITSYYQSILTDQTT